MTGFVMNCGIRFVFWGIRRPFDIDFRKSLFSRFLSSTKHSEPALENCINGPLSTEKTSENVENMFVNSTTSHERDMLSLRDQAKRVERPKIDPRDTSIILFPGQGVQYVGMGQKGQKSPKVVELFKVANEVLGYDLLKLCLDGPKEELDKTVHCQPAVFVTSLAAVELLRIQYPSAISNCVVTAGFSVGEITSLVFAGALSFEEGVEIVKVRAEAMQAICDSVPSGMMTVFYGPDSQLGYACLRAKEWCLQRGIEAPECRIANYLYPHCKVIAGHLEALKYIQANSAVFKLRKTKYLPVSGAFHTDIMKSAAVDLKKILNKVSINKPNIPVVSNVDVRVYRHSGHIVKLLPKQIYKPVKWEQTLHTLYERNQGEHFPNTYECGPGSSLKALLKMVNLKAWNNCVSINV